MDLDRVQKPLRQLRKSLKQLPDDPLPAEVHKLRTRARHIEAIAAAVTEPNDKRTGRLLKSIKPVRKAAGNVRDMDVLTSNALTLRQNHGQKSLVRLIERLGIARRKSATDLIDTVDQRRKAARRLLKQYAKRVQSALDHKHARQPNGNSTQAEQHVQAVVAELKDELRRWPALNAGNIHPFRLKVKELRSILQLLPDADANLVNALGSVKDQIGDWHDWQQLAQTAAQMLDSSKDRGLVIQIDKIGRKKLNCALTSANALRKRYFRLSSRRRVSG